MHCKREEKAKGKLEKKNYTNYKDQRKEVALQNLKTQREERRQRFMTIFWNYRCHPTQDVVTEICVNGLVKQFCGTWQSRLHETKTLFPSSTHGTA